MQSSFEKKLKLTKTEHEELISFCELNKLDEEKIVKKSYKQGFNIEKYGLLSGNAPTSEPEIQYVEKEVIKYVEKPVEIIKEVPVEIIVEVPTPPTEVKVVEYVDREVFIEVPVEKIVEKIVNIYDNSQIDELILKIKELEEREPEKIEIIKEVPVEIIKEVPTQIDPSKTKMLEETLHNLRVEMREKDKKIKELETNILEFQKNKLNLGAVFLRGSNLDETLYK